MFHSLYRLDHKTKRWYKRIEIYRNLEKCVLLPFENKEVCHLNNIIGEHEITIKSLHEILEQMLEASDRDVVIKNLLKENDN